MTDYVTIANLAASMIGEDDQMRSPDDDTHIGRTVRAVFTAMRRATIRDHSWNFAMRRKALAAQAPGDLDDGAVPWPWAYSCPMPAESLRLIEVMNASSKGDWQYEGGSILTNVAPPLYVRYLIDVEEPALWDELFVQAFAARLAYQIGPRIAGSSYDKTAGWRLYQSQLSTAKGRDALENPPVELELTDWELARLGYSAYGSGLSGQSGPTGRIVL